MGKFRLNPSEKPETSSKVVEPVIIERIVEKPVVEIREVQVEVIKEVPVEVIKEVPVKVIETVEKPVYVEVVKEVIKEVPKEIVVEKEVERVIHVKDFELIRKNKRLQMANYFFLGLSLVLTLILVLS